MTGVVDFVFDVADAVWNGVTSIAEGIWSTLWDEILNPILEPVFGLFGFEDETIVEVQVVTQRYFPDDPKFVPTFIRNIITSITERTDLMDEVRIGLLNNGYSSARKAYYYAKLGESRVPTSDVGDGYVFGVPDISKSYGSFDTEALDEILLSFHYAPPYLTNSIEYNTLFFGDVIRQDIDPQRYWAWFYMQENDASWDQALLSIDVGGDSYTYDSTSYNSGLLVWEILFYDTATGLIPHIVNPSIDPPDSQTLHYVVIYETYTSTTLDGTYIWIYDATSGVFPQLEQEVDGLVTASAGWQFMPVIPLKADGAYLDDNKTTQEYLTTRVMLRYLGINLDDTIAAIKENPNAAQVTDGFVHFAAGLYDDNQAINKYLFSFFYNIASNSAVSKAQYEADLANSKVTTAPFNAIAFKEQNFNMVLEFNYIHIETLTGNVGAINYVNKTINYTGAKAKQHPTDNIVFTVQDSPTTYIKVTVYGIAMLHIVSTSIGILKTKAIAMVNPASTTDEDERAKNNLMIPISLTSLMSYGSILDKETVIYRSVKFTIYAEQITELEWYETEAFADFVGIVITIASIAMGDFSGQTGAQIAKQIIKQVLIQIALQYALKLVFEATDNKFIRALATIAYAYASGWNAGLDMKALTDIRVVLTYVDAVGKGWLQMEADDLLAEIEDFEQLKEEAEAELDRVSDLVDWDTGVGEVLTLVQQNRILSYETFDGYYARTLETNPGVQTLDQIRDYYDRALQLPKLNPTVDTTNIVIDVDEDTVTT